MNLTIFTIVDCLKLLLMTNKRNLLHLDASKNIISKSVLKVISGRKGAVKIIMSLNRENFLEVNGIKGSSWTKIDCSRLHFNARTIMWDTKTTCDITARINMKTIVLILMTKEILKIKTRNLNRTKILYPIAN